VQPGERAKLKSRTRVGWLQFDLVIWTRAEPGARLLKNLVKYRARGLGT